MKKIIIVILIVTFMAIAIFKLFAEMWETTNVDTIANPLVSCLSARSSFCVTENN